MFEFPHITTTNAHRRDILEVENLIASGAEGRELGMVDHIGKAKEITLTEVSGSSARLCSELLGRYPRTY